MNVHEPIGYLASLLVLTTFCMRDMPTLRLVAIASNLAFISYGLLAEIGPVLLLHTLLLPINLYRLVQALRHQGQPGNPEKEGSIRANTHTQQLQASGRPAGSQVKEVSMKKRFSFIPALMVLALMAGCAPSAPTIASVTVSPNPTTVLVGRTQTFTAVAKDASGNVVNANFTWSSSDTAVATINATGVASSVAVGTTTITATTGGVSGSATLNVTQADSPPPPPPPPSGDTTPPSIVSITPANLAKGVAKDANIVIVFSEKMNQAVTQAAYQSADLPAAAVTFIWNAGGTELTIKPNADLEYTAAGKNYAFSLTSTATDLAGNPLAPVNSSFTTFRELTRTLTSMAALDGDVRGDGDVATAGSFMEAGDSATADNAQYKSFVSFDLSGLQADGLTLASRITAAELRVYQEGDIGSPYADLKLGGKSLMAAHVNYGPALNAGDFNTPILHDLGEIAANNIVEYKEKSNALDSVRDDWANRAGRGNRSQFMFYFARATDGDGSHDAAHLTAGESTTNPPQLEVKFLVP